MKTNRISNRTLATIAAPALIAGAMLIPGTASASESGATQCANYGLGGVQLAIGATTTGPSIPVSIPANAYTTIMGTSSDSYTDRSLGYAQPNEQFRLQFLDASGSVIATSGPSGDLADDVDSATWTGGLGVVTPSADVAYVRAVHAGGEPTTANSLTPVSTGLCWTPQVIIDEPVEEPVEEPAEEETPAEELDGDTQVAGQGAEGEPEAPAVIDDEPAEEPQAAAPVAEAAPVVADPAPKADTSPTAAPDTEVAAAASDRGALPETGSETIVFAGLGSILMAAGRGLIRVSNRNA